MPCSVLPLDQQHADAWHRLRLTLWPDAVAEDFATIRRDYFTTGIISGLPHAVFIAFDDNERPIGFAEASLRPYAEGAATTPAGYLEGWFVAPEHRGKGVGRALVNACERWARTRGCTEFASDTEIDNAASCRAHAALGFREVEIIRCFLKNL